ncbi:MAG: aldo/keto reductase [Thermoleophilaceae bacterium]|nr:aldo/keto reductase [Thermoleophilaceae bacterium]
MPDAQIALGLAALGRPAYINLGHDEDVADSNVERMERMAHAVLDAAYEGGVRWLDAARSYGRAEAFLASWLARRGLQPGDVTVSSKWGYRYTAGWRVDVPEHEVKDLSVEHFRTQWRETRELLGDHVGVYQIHSATLDSGVLDDPAVRQELDALRARGIRVGLTVTGPEQAATIERALATGGFDAVQATWNLYERSAEVSLARAHEAGLRVLVKEALANGRLAARGADQTLAATARERGASEDAVALGAALARPWADVVLSGAATVAQLESNLAALDLAWDDKLEQRLAGLVEEPAAYWAARAELPWT